MLNVHGILRWTAAVAALIILLVPWVTMAPAQSTPGYDKAKANCLRVERLSHPQHPERAIEDWQSRFEACIRTELEIECALDTPEQLRKLKMLDSCGRLQLTGGSADAQAIIDSAKNLKMDARMLAALVHYETNLQREP